jgi:hypothetical protein
LQKWMPELWQTELMILLQLLRSTYLGTIQSSLRLIHVYIFYYIDCTRTYLSQFHKNFNQEPILRSRVTTTAL